MSEWKDTAVDLRNTGHFILGKKGGTGKTFTASILAEYIRDGMTSGHVLGPGDASGFMVFDADPSNYSLSQVGSLNARRAAIFPRSGEVDVAELDRVFAPGEFGEEVRVVDMGSTGYVEILQYLRETEIFDLWNQTGKRVFLHTPLCGGERLGSTLKALGEIMENFPEADIMVWCNDYDPGRTSTGILSVQDWLETEGGIYAKNPDAPEIGLAEALSAPGPQVHSGLTQQASSAIFRHMMRRTRNLAQYIVVANSAVSGLKYIRTSITEARGRNMGFLEFINDPSFTFADRQRIRAYLYDERRGVFPSIHKAFASLFACVKEKPVSKKKGSGEE